MATIAAITILLAGAAVIALIADYGRIRLIHFQRDSRRGTRHWEFAFNDVDLCDKLNGDMAYVEMPASPVAVRLWRKIRPLKFVELTADWDKSDEAKYREAAKQ